MDDGIKDPYESPMEMSSMASLGLNLARPRLGNLGGSHLCPAVAGTVFLLIVCGLLVPVTTQYMKEHSSVL